MQMLQHNAPVDPGLTEIGRFPPLPQLLVKESLDHPPIFFPPAPDRAHIVGGRRHHGQIRRFGWMEELPCRVLGHALYLQAKYSQLTHYIRHTTGHHAKVLSKDQHVRSPLERRQLVHSLFLPKIILSVEEIVDIK